MGLVPIRVFVFVVFFLHYFFLLPIVHYKYWIELKLTVSKQGGGAPWIASVLRGCSGRCSSLGFRLIPLLTATKSHILLLFQPCLDLIGHR